jgi:hypothetical protein
MNVFTRKNVLKIIIFYFFFHTIILILVLIGEKYLNFEKNYNQYPALYNELKNSIYDWKKPLL